MKYTKFVFIPFASFTLYEIVHWLTDSATRYTRELPFYDIKARKKPSVFTVRGEKKKRKLFPRILWHRQHTKVHYLHDQGRHQKESVWVEMASGNCAMYYYTPNTVVVRVEKKRRWRNNNEVGKQSLQDKFLHKLAHLFSRRLFSRPWLSPLRFMNKSEAQTGCMLQKITRGRRLLLYTRQL